MTFCQLFNKEIEKLFNYMLEPWCIAVNDFNVARLSGKLPFLVAPGLKGFSDSFSPSKFHWWYSKLQISSSLPVWKSLLSLAFQQKLKKSFMSQKSEAVCKDKSFFERYNEITSFFCFSSRKFCLAWTSWFFSFQLILREILNYQKLT